MMGKKLKDIIFGFCLLLFSILLFVSLFSYDENDASFFVATLQNANVFGRFGANLSGIFFQLFGSFGFVVAFVAGIWGWNFMSGAIYNIKHKCLTIFSFVLFGCVILTVLSSNTLGISFLKKLHMNCSNAGGAIGYIVTKLIFIEILREEKLWKFCFCLISAVWLIVAKKALFVNFATISTISTIGGNTNKIFALFRKKFAGGKFEEQKKHTHEQPTRHTPVWQKIPQSEKTDVAELEEYLQDDLRGKQDESKKDFELQGESDGVVEENFFGFVSGGEYILPYIGLLDKNQERTICIDDKKIQETSVMLCEVLEEFGVKGVVLNAHQGPVVTMFEFRPAPGIKTSRIISLSDDIARSMSATSARIATISGQNAIGIELPNKERQTVYFADLVSSDSFATFNVGIPLILGKDISGKPIIADLARMPHLLVAGTTGSGKSVSINDMILSILFKFAPEKCKLIMIDPKMLELSVYDEIPHLLTPVVTDPKKAVFALKWAVAEMENRYLQMSRLGVRNIEGFNKKLKASREKGDLLVRKVQTGFDQETGRPIFETQQLEFDEMPYIVIVVDEMADLMLVAGKEIESAVQRLAQMARAAGIHLIMATQRPSVDVITGTIKANFPTRISFQVTSKIDSRTILGEQGAEQLLGQGDMLYMSGASRITRIHGPFVKDSEVERIVSYIKGQKEPEYAAVISESFLQQSSSVSGQSDEMYAKAMEIILSEKKVSISYLQRRLQIGYNRAAKIIEEMETQGVVSAPNHSGKREILI